jgi:Flp pilus assembly protein TadB
VSVQPDEQIDVTKTEARAGSTPHVTRYVLLFSLILVIAAFIAIVGFGAK